MKIKIHKTYRDVVAICDSNLLGKRFEEGEKQLHITENFYGGKEINEKELTEQIEKLTKQDATFNIVGKKSIGIGIKSGIISKKGVMEVKNIPFALVLI